MPLIDAATPAALAAMSVSGLGNGQLAWIDAMRVGGGPGLFILQPTLSTAPDSFFVIPTFDDPLRQWVYNQIQEQGNLGLWTPEIDLTVAPQTIVLLPPLTGYKFIFAQAFQWVITAKNGTVTTGPFANTGTDATFTDVYGNANSLIAATNLDQGGAFQNTATNPGANNKDLGPRGLKTVITVASVLGTATVHKARIRTSLQFAKY